MVSTTFLTLLLASSLADLTAGFSISDMPDVEYLNRDFDEMSFSSIALPTPEITVNASSNYWRGEERHYSIKQDDGTFERYSFHIIETPVSSDDPDLNQSPRRDVQLESSFDTRDNWVCQWGVACYEAARYYGYVGVAGINLAASQTGDYLRSDNYAPLKTVIGGSIMQFSLGIASNVASFYITNKLQTVQSPSPDTCDCSHYEVAISAIQADIKDILTNQNAQNGKPCYYDHFSQDTAATTKRIGPQLTHTTMPTQNPNEYKSITACQ